MRGWRGFVLVATVGAAVVLQAPVVGAASCKHDVDWREDTGSARAYVNDSGGSVLLEYQAPGSDEHPPTEVSFTGTVAAPPGRYALEMTISAGAADSDFRIHLDGAIDTKSKKIITATVAPFKNKTLRYQITVEGTQLKLRVSAKGRGKLWAQVELVNLCRV